MKRLSIALLALLATGFTACQAVEEEDSCCTKPVAETGLTDKTTTASWVGGLTDMSVYNLETDWQNQDGKTLKLEDLQGKIQLVSMVYTSCGYACPRLVADMKRIENGLANYKREDIGIILVTMDPERDTPERLKEFADVNNLAPDRWTLLTSKPDDIQELAVLLNMKYKKELNGEISHSNIISVLNARGEIIHQQEGLGENPEPTIEAIKGLFKSI